MNRRLCWLLALAGVAAIVAALVAVRSDLSWRYRKAQRSIAEKLDRQDRFIDYGVKIRVVRADPKGKALIRGKPALKLAVVDEIHRGGIWDTLELDYVGPSQNPVVWLVDEIGLPVILHGDDLPVNLLVEGSMGGGKTVLTVQWTILRALEHAGTGGEIGFTAPTRARMGEALRDFRELTRRDWYRWSARDHMALFHCDARVMFVSTHKGSRDEGSRIQGQGWVAAATEEIQDAVDEDGNIEARGRDAAETFKRCVNATIKDFPKYRSWKNRVLEAREFLPGDGDEKPTGPKLWGHVRKLGVQSPFVPESWWRRLRGTLTDEEYRRKVLCEDVASEARVYYKFDRSRNVMPLPTIGARDVTQRELERHGTYQFLLAHDPGRVWDVTEVLRAYELPLAARIAQLPPEKQAEIRRLPEKRLAEMGLLDPVWFVIGEISSKRTTTEGHVRDVKQRMRERFGAAPAHCFVKADSTTKGHRDEEQPHVTVYKVWQEAGFRIQPAAYRPARPGHAPEAALIPVEARLDLVNTLLCNADGVTRLIVGQNDRGELLAPKLVEGFEGLEKDEFGYAERGRKDDTDLTHWPCAVGYGLWALEWTRINHRRAG